MSAAKLAQMLEGARFDSDDSNKEVIVTTQTGAQIRIPVDAPLYEMCLSCHRTIFGCRFASPPDSIESYCSMSCWEKGQDSHRVRTGRTISFASAEDAILVHCDDGSITRVSGQTWRAASRPAKGGAQ